MVNGVTSGLKTHRSLYLRADSLTYAGCHRRASVITERGDNAINADDPRLLYKPRLPANIPIRQKRRWCVGRPLRQ